ncbi:MAG: choice-of-anchor J domain-containing protein [Bacteroidales bacterium]|nr:choice-of-anchor J domain-containing protein [Bacteroidales bacterium]
MKRKQLLTALLLMALFAPWAANAQETANVVSGGTGTNQYVPMYNYYNDYGHRSEYIIPASYFATAGINEGDQLTSMTIYRSATGTWTAKNLTIILTNTTTSYYDNTSFLGKEGTTVYSSSSYPGGSASSYIFPFTEPFEYTGGSLVVHIWAGNGGTCTSSSNSSTWLGYNNTENSQALYASGSNSANASTGSRLSFLPNTTFTYTPAEAPACPKPTNLTVSNLTSNSAAVNWESDGNWFHYQYRESGEEEWIEHGGNGETGNTFASLTEVLEPNTTYEFRVQNICNLDPLEESTYATTQFTTACGITSFPWTEDFESYNASTVPECWDNSASTSSTLSSYPYYIWGVYSYSNNKMLRMNNYNVQSGTALINTMPVDLPAEGEYQFAFDYSHRASCGAFKVKISTDGGTTFTDLRSYTNTSTNSYYNPDTFTTAEPISLAAYAGQTVILQFYANANNGSGAIFLDNVSISKVPTCLPPTGLTVSFTETGYRFSWDAESGYQFYYTDAPVGNDPVWSASYTTDNYIDYLNHYLSYNEDWTFYLRKKCSEDDYSEPVSITFHTKCATTTALGYTENFDGYTVTSAYTPSTRTLPDCWNAINTTTYATYSVYPSIYNYNNNAHSGSNCIRFYSYYSSSYDPQPQYAILPVMDDLSGVQVTLQAKGSNDASTFKLGTMTNPNDVSTFTAIYEQELTTSYQRFVYNIPANTTDKYLVFKIDAASSSRTANGVYIDDIAIPTCSEPTDLEVLELTAHSVTIAWYAEGGDMFQEDFNTLSFDPNEPPTSWSHTADYYNQAHWDGLEPEHFYGIWVRKYCSETDQSAPVYITFTTPEACPAPTGLQVVENSITSTGASFTWDAEEGASFEYFTVSDPWEGYEPAVDQSWTSTSNNTVGWTNAFPANSVTRFYLRKNCGSEGYSDYTYVEFRTACGPVSLADGYSENFDDNTFTSVSIGTGAPEGYPDVSLPYCWQFLNRSESTSTYPQAFLTSYSTYAVSGNCLFFTSSHTTPLYAILPEFVQDISEYQLTFTYRNEGTDNSNGKLYVGYMTDPSDASTFVQTLACEQTTTKTTKTAYFANAPQGSFMAFKYEGGTYDYYYLSIDNVVVSNGPACFPTGTLSYGELSAHTAKLSWDLVDETQDAWVVEYSKSNQFFEPVYTVNADTHENFVLTGLDAETTYYVRVRGNCGEGSLSDVSNTISFTTAEACPLPTDLVASNLTQVSADLSWTGSVDVQQYQVWFRRAEQVVGIDEQFNTNTLPDRWERKQGLLDNIMNGTENLTSGDYNWYMGTTNGVFDSHAYINIFGTSRKDWLITPSYNVQSGDVVIFDLALTAYSGTQGAPATTGTDDRFVVLATIDNGQTWTILCEWNNSGSEYVYNDIAHTATGEQVSIDLTEYTGWDVRIAFYGESTERNADNNLHIDNVKIGTEYAAGGGNIVESQTTSVQLLGLEANMIYDVQVRSMCSDTWTDIFNFKTLDQNTKVFIGGQPLDGYDLEEVSDKWWNPYNWVPYGMPSAFNDSPKDDVILRHDAVISINLITGRNTIADANSITFEGTPKPTLTLEDGNQLRLNTEIDQPDVITVKKNIIGYAGTKDQYYLISSPVQWAGQYNPANGIVTTESDYDLYAFDPAASDGLEWRNYKADPTNFKMDWGTGYLYANAADVMISVTGPVMDNKQPDEIFNYNYYENEEYSFNGWKLCGNTFTCNAYLSSDSQTMAFYRMNAEGTGFEAVTSFIKPMEGFFLQNTVNGKSVVLSRTAPSKGVRCLNLVLSQVAAHRVGVSTGSTTLDNAIIRFDEGNTLEKLSFREGSSKVYIKQEGKDYAVVNVEGQVGEVPVSFVPESNGTYSLSFTSEEVSFSYLHLIDNLTGEDVDLLAGASTGSAAYTFNARTTDYESRFRLVFATGSSVTDDTFGFVNASGNFCIFGIEGEATVQVIDVLGHVLSSEQFSGSYERHLNVAPGVYMIRLIQGNDVKVQKVVVR